MKKYLVIGTGGVGGSIAGFLSQAGRDVTCIARGSHKEALEVHGLTLNSDIKGTTVSSPVRVFTTAEYIEQCQKMTDAEKPQVIIVAVKGYSLSSIVEVVRAASHPGAVVLPILNVYGTGQRLKELLGETPAMVLDGCIYIVAFKTAPGVIRQSGRVLKVVMGSSEEGFVVNALTSVAEDMEQCGIRVKVSEDIRLDTFMKWGFISAMAGTGAYHDCPMGPIQQPGEERDTLVGLLQESEAVGRALGIDLPTDYIAKNLDIIDHCTPDTTSSMQKDMASQHQSEIDGQIFSMADLGHRLGLEMLTYDRVCSKFMKYNANHD